MRPPEAILEEDIRLIKNERLKFYAAFFDRGAIVLLIAA